jgi:hypothetical protein
LKVNFEKGSRPWETRAAKKNKQKSQKQSNDKNRQKAKKKLEKQQKGPPVLVLPHRQS